MEHISAVHFDVKWRADTGFYSLAHCPVCASSMSSADELNDWQISAFVALENSLGRLAEHVSEYHGELRVLIKLH